MVRKVFAALAASVLSAGLFSALVWLSFQRLSDAGDFSADFGRSFIEAPETSGDAGVERLAEDDADLVKKIDFGTLQSINDEAAAWIYIPDPGNVTETHPEIMAEGLPVMQEPEGQPAWEAKYLWRDIYGVVDKSKGGSLFMPYVPGGTDAVQLIFGHRMKDRTLAFSSMKFFLEKEYFDAHRYVYLYYPDRAERYEVWAAGNAYGGSLDGKVNPDIIYRTQPVWTTGDAEYGALLNHIREDLCANGQLSERDVTRDDKLLVLSTCYQDDTRMFLGCVLDKVYYYEGDFDITEAESE